MMHVSRRGFSRTLLPVLVGLLSLAARNPVDDGAMVDLKRWLEGPARYVASDEEMKAFKSLKNDDSRAVFIERFWARRDPVPETLINEYRQKFWNRVRETEDKFLDSAGPGWATDRGRIYILLGPPSEIQEDTNAETDAGPTVSRGLIRWIYDGRSETRNSIDPVVVIPFVRTMTGEYKISFEPRLAALGLDWSTLRREAGSPFQKYLQENASPTKSRLGVMLDLGRLQDVPSQAQVLLDNVETVESYRTHPLALDVARYEPPGTAGSLVVLTTALGGEPGRSATVLARLVCRDAKIPPVVLDESSFRVEGKDLDRLAQARTVLAPGQWDVTAMAVEAHEGGSTGIYRATIVIPPRTDALHLSDVQLTRTLEPIAYRSLVTYEEPFVIGTFKVTPLAGRPLRRGDSVQFFHEVYGGSAPFRISYQLEGKENDGHFRPLGRPSSREGPDRSQGFEIPTGPAWPVGDYRMRIDVEDARGAKATATLPFRLDAAAN